MATVLTETDTYDATVTVPADGDTANATSISGAGVGFQPLANRTNYLSNRIHVPSSGIVRPNLFSFTTEVDDGTDWVRAVQASGDTLSYYSQFAASSQPLIAPLPQLVGGTITEIRAYIDPLTGRGGLPATMPRLFLDSIDGSTSETKTNHDDIIDPSASLGAYETFHSFAKAVSVVVDENRTYWLRFKGESGASSQSGLRLTACQITLTF